MEFFRKILMQYFIIVTGITLIMALLGVLYLPGESIGYEAFFSPFLFATMATLPSIATYSKRELSLRQMRFRLVFQWMLLEAIILPFCLLFKIISLEMTGPLFLSILILYLAVHLIEWLIGNKKARELTRDLQSYQQTEKAGH